MLNNVRFQKTAYWFLMLTIFLAFKVFSSQYRGPAYLSDEIGYLTKAAAFAGYSVDMASSWHGGYSLMLSPLFMISSDPFVIWQRIMLFNAVVWTFSFMLLFTILKEFFPQRSYWAIYYAVTLSAIYPAWITMSGYAFSTTGFVFVFMLTLFILQKISTENIWSILPYSILVGFLYWIHPTGLAVAVASTISITAYAKYSRQCMFIYVHVFVTMAMILVYKMGVHEWLSQLMTPENYPVLTHYPTLSTVLQSFFSLKFWVTWGGVTFGQFSYLLIASFGVLLFAIMEALNRVMPTKKVVKKIDSSLLVNTSLAYMLLSILGVILLGALSFATLSETDLIRPDHWIYGRYSEVVLLPLLGVGYLGSWRNKYATIASLIVLLSSMVLHLYINEANTSSNNNLVNIQSFWPQALFADESFIFWFTAGASGILLANILQKKLFGILAIPLFFNSILNQSEWHKSILLDHSQPSSLVDLVTLNFKEGQCIGFDKVSSLGFDTYSKQRERYNLYAYYFFNYRIRRMTVEEWRSSCDGPYLTYNADTFFESSAEKVIAREVSSGLYLVTKTEMLDTISFKLLPTSVADLYIDLTRKNRCMMKGCFYMSSSNLVRFMPVGRFENGSIVTTGKNGYLFYGPYSPLKKGQYNLRLEGEFLDLQGAVLDISSENGNTKHLDIVLSEYLYLANKSIIVPFSISSDVSDIEIRLRVSSRTKLVFYAYSIGLNDSGEY